MCPKCGSQLARKGDHRLAYRSVFGRLSIDSPRFYRCRCSGSGRQSVSPLANCLSERTSPELQYLQAKFAALMSYRLTVQVLEEMLPLGHVLAATTIRRHVAAPESGDVANNVPCFPCRPTIVHRHIPATLREAERQATTDASRGSRDQHCTGAVRNSLRRRNAHCLMPMNYDYPEEFSTCSLRYARVEQDKCHERRSSVSAASRILIYERRMIMRTIDDVTKNARSDRWRSAGSPESCLTNPAPGLGRLQY